MNGGQAGRTAAANASSVFGLAAGASSTDLSHRTGRTDREAFPFRGDPA